MKVFQMRLKELRTTRNLSQKRLAELLGTTNSSVCDWERGRTEPDGAFLLKLALVLNVSTDYLLGRTDELGAMIPSERALQLTEGEGEMLRLFRLISPSLQEVAIDTLRVWANESRKNALPKNA